ncbi:hypothetical protein MBLNU459_g1569t1 [Dothideomycetes sp. NU459]
MPPVSILEVDDFLHDLASQCKFSAPEIRREGDSSRERSGVLGSIVLRLYPKEAKWIVRLLLKDFSPVVLDETVVLRSFHFLLPDLLKVQYNFDASFAALKDLFKHYPSRPDPQSAIILRQTAAASFKPSPEDCILSFDKIRKHVSRAGAFLGADQDSPVPQGEQLMIVFFDLLLVDDEILLPESIELRKARLSGLYRKISGRAMTAESTVVDFSEPQSKHRLMHHFAASIAARHEGLILKPCGVPYFPLSLAAENTQCGSNKFIKLKKDYISGLGDEADFAVIGASYDATEANNLDEKVPSEQNIYFSSPFVVFLDPSNSSVSSRHRKALSIRGVTVVQDLVHWDRDAWAYDALSDTVSESQSYPGLRKVVLVDGKIPQHVLGAVARVQAMNHGQLRERVEFYDYDVVETLCDLDRSMREGEGPDRNWEMERYSVGAIIFDTDTKQSVFVPRTAGSSADQPTAE